MTSEKDEPFSAGRPGQPVLPNARVPIGPAGARSFNVRFGGALSPLEKKSYLSETGTVDVSEQGVVVTGMRIERPQSGAGEIIASLLGGLIVGIALSAAKRKATRRGQVSYMIGPGTGLAVCDEQREVVALQITADTWAVFKVVSDEFHAFPEFCDCLERFYGPRLERRRLPRITKAERVLLGFIILWVIVMTAVVLYKLL